MNGKGIVAIVVIGLMIVSGLTLLIPVNHSEMPLIARVLTGNTYTWIADSQSTASAAGSWDPSGPPGTGDIVVFNSVHRGACTWDLAISLSSFTVGAGYSNYINYTANFGVSDLTLASGNLRGNTVARITVSGNFVQTNGNIDNDRLIMTMTGANKYLNMSSSAKILGLTVNGTITTKDTGYTEYYVTSLIVNSGAMLIISAGMKLESLTYGSGYAYTNLGAINGLGTLEYTFLSADKTIASGAVNCPLQIRLLVSASTNQTCTLGSNWMLGSTFEVLSSHASKFMILVGNGYDLTDSGVFTVSTRGFIEQGSGTWAVGSYLQNGADAYLFVQGSFTTGDVNITDGHLIGNTLALFTCSGDFIKWGDTVHNDQLRLRMTGTNKQLRYATNDAANLYDLWISGTILMNGLVGININHNVTIDAGATLNITTVINLSWRTYSFANNQWANNGIITGVGWTRFIFYNVSKTIWNNGTDSAAMVSIRLLDIATQNCTATMGAGSHNFASTVQVYADDEDYLMTFDSTNMGVTLTTAYFKIGPYGRLIGYTGIQLNPPAGYHVWMNTTIYNPSTVFANGIAARFTVETDDIDALTTYTIIGLNPAYGYKIYSNGVQIASGVSGSSLSFEIAGNATIEVIVWYPSNILPLVQLILIFFTIGVVMAPVVWAVKLTKDRKKAEMQDLFRVFIFIIIGLVAIGIVWSLA